MDRGCITYSAAYIAGIYLGNLIILPFSLSATILVSLLILCIASKKRYRTFLTASHLAIAVTGATACNLALSQQDSTHNRLHNFIFSKSSCVKDKTESYLEKFCNCKENHATLCALAIGGKGELDKELLNSYSNAGAMHILALSGLHIGIIYAILGTLLTPLHLAAQGKIIKEIILLLFLVIYSLVCGAPPSVVRASTMIIVYRIGKRSFRDVSKWDSLALSALVIGIFSPLQVCSAGFQLSYAAVIGISLIFPVCNSAFNKMARLVSISNEATKLILKKVWENIAISICCQIATIPFILYHFGNVPSHFIVTNIVAVPLATAILHIFSLLLIFQWIPFANCILNFLLNFFIELLNSSIIFISD